MDWPRLGAVLHTTGLWGRSYLGVGRRAASRTWQKLCHREDTGLPWGKPYRGRIHIWDYPKGNQAIRTPSPVQGLTEDPGELTPVLGLASDCSAQSDCQGCLEDSTRVHRPGNWTGGEKGARIPGWGGMAQQAWHRPVLLAHYLPNTREETGRQRAARSFWRSGCGSRICAMLLRDTATLRLDLPPPRAVLAGSPPDRRRAWWEPWAHIQAGVSRQRESSTGPNTRHSSLTENAWRSPTRLMEVSAVRSAVLRDRNFSSTESSGSKGPLWSPDRTIERSQEGTRGGLEGFILLAPFRNLTMRSCFPRDRPSTASWWAAIAATYTFKVEGDSLRSNLSCRKESTTPIVHLRGSSRREGHQVANRLHFSA